MLGNEFDRKIVLRWGAIVLLSVLIILLGVCAIKLVKENKESDAKNEDWVSIHKNYVGKWMSDEDGKFLGTTDVEIAFEYNCVLEGNSYVHNLKGTLTTEYGTASGCSKYVDFSLAGDGVPVFWFENEDGSAIQIVGNPKEGEFELRIIDQYVDPLKSKMIVKDSFSHKEEYVVGETIDKQEFGRYYPFFLENYLESEDWIVSVEEGGGLSFDSVSRGYKRMCGCQI